MHVFYNLKICGIDSLNLVYYEHFQKYRHIDYVTFENGNIMDRFLNYWRNSGSQRMGFLIGRYEQHPDIPLGIRAVVSAIYEPPQVYIVYVCTRVFIFSMTIIPFSVKMYIYNLEF